MDLSLRVAVPLVTVPLALVVNSIAITDLPFTPAGPVAPVAPCAPVSPLSLLSPLGPCVPNDTSVHTPKL